MHFADYSRVLAFIRLLLGWGEYDHLHMFGILPSEIAGRLR